ncbi:4-hydroxybenzoate 3-monooxygenase [Roseobacter denitrificans]|uniref:p-hydroxybenzoate hydroxylase n=1 Tax=Roseobacter denitrificans (strain ATCC 33942 / OCh 114) TaxID=375451 RepID=Q167D1_ROSDO|nr:4-hydroxybenzoate 3-monooxygenase [Roseobacter denitrificans]ABG31912.1 p-hydroxybenzoate hydroxylase [Roseobacter denitrificans OCh 114]AVL54690.1 4-hydroxybenzoate 3-monooxygenase [Roseobacter denitrificans]
MRTQVVIIGGGPSGLLLAQLLHTCGIDSIVLERRTRAHVLARIRAGVLETGLIDLLEQAGAGARVRQDGMPHEGTWISYGDEAFRIDFAKHTGKSVMVYGQTEVTRDLYAARDRTGGQTEFEVEDVRIEGADSDAPAVSYLQTGQRKRIACDFIAGCDGFHGVSRTSIPEAKRRYYEKTYPFGWLGILSETPPVNDELIYANSDRGFALCSMRTPSLSRYYIQCEAGDHTDNWSDDAFWAELKRRLPAEQAANLITGPSIEKSIAPLRSFVCEPMQWGRLFLCGDAAHIVPPTGAKGLNTAASDVHYLFSALSRWYQNNDADAVAQYSQHALARVWKAERFSWWFSKLMHRFPHHSGFDLRMQRAEIEFLRSNQAAQQAMAENYVGLPYDD